MRGKLTVILSKARTAEPDSETLEQAILAGLDRWSGISVVVVPHLYDLNPAGAGMEAIRATGGDLVVLAWLYPRAAYWMLNANGVRARLGRTTSLAPDDRDESASRDPSQRMLWCFDLRTYGRAEAYLEEIAMIASALPVASEEVVSTGASGHVQVLDEVTRPRWYPVIDYDRCAGCLECLNFCLFGVYGLDAKDSVLVEQPDACRAGCPACSRICPQGAIMFPQHDDPAIAGGANGSAAKLNLDLTQLAGRSGATTLADDDREQALAEQREHVDGPSDELDRLVSDLDDLEL